MNYFIYNGKTQYSWDDFTTELMNENLKIGHVYNVRDITHRYDKSLKRHNKKGPVYEILDDDGCSWYYPHESFEPAFR